MSYYIIEIENILWIIKLIKTLGTAQNTQKYNKTMDIAFFIVFNQSQSFNNFLAIII